MREQQALEPDPYMCLIPDSDTYQLGKSCNCSEPVFLICKVKIVIGELNIGLHTVNDPEAVLIKCRFMENYVPSSKHLYFGIITCK